MLSADKVHGFYIEDVMICLQKYLKLFPFATFSFVATKKRSKKRNILFFKLNRTSEGQIFHSTITIRRLLRRRIFIYSFFAAYTLCFFFCTHSLPSPFSLSIIFRIIIMQKYSNSNSIRMYRYIIHIHTQNLIY